MNKENLIATAEVQVRFNEVDSLGIVWHGHYLKYFEDGREAFGQKYGINYMDVYKEGLLSPVVKIDCNYKLPLTYGDSLIIEVKYIYTESAKIIFEYKITRKSDGAIAATGNSTQVFLNVERELILTNPVFYENWKKRWGLISE